jgi:hypothetical protein
MQRKHPGIMVSDMIKRIGAPLVEWGGGGGEVIFCETNIKQFIHRVASIPAGQQWQNEATLHADSSQRRRRPYCRRHRRRPPPRPRPACALAPAPAPRRR